MVFNELTKSELRELGASSEEEAAKSALDEILKEFEK